MRQLCILIVLLVSLPTFRPRAQEGASMPDLSSPSHYNAHSLEGTPLKGLRVALDVGHNKKAVGARSARGRGEFYFNADTTKVITAALEKAGATVVVINGDGMTTGLAERGAAAMKAKAHCLISIHHDSVNDKYTKPWTFEGKQLLYADDFRGYSVFASSLNQQAENSQVLAKEVGKALYQTGMRPTFHHNEPIEGENRAFIEKATGVYEFTNLVVLKSSPMPAILLECGVIIHRDEELLVQEDWYRELIAGALVKALAESYQAGAIGKKRPGGFLRQLFGQ